MLEWGFEKVGTHFPVFLHPISQEEYTLARTEEGVDARLSAFVIGVSFDNNNDCKWRVYDSYGLSDAFDKVSDSTFKSQRK